MSDYSTSDLAQLWIQAGGPSDVAELMGAIGMAESNGNPGAKNPSSGACGLWQIYPPETGCDNPFTNAQIAVRKYHTQGLNAWEAYTNGSYRRYSGSAFLSSSTSSSSGVCHTFSLFGNCADGISGIASIVMGIALVSAAIWLIVLSSPSTETALKTAVMVAK
jgi:hypothetical protein